MKNLQPIDNQQISNPLKTNQLRWERTGRCWAQPFSSLWFYIVCYLAAPNVTQTLMG
jgi:hypothetical protein